MNLNLNLTWSEVIDYFETPDNMMQMIKETDYIDTTYTCYNQFSEWVSHQKYQAIGNYPELYNAVSQHECLVNIIYLISIFWLIDNLFIKRWLNKARWFVLHTIANAIIVYFVWNDVYSLFRNPIMAFNRKPDYSGLNITVALHFYHAMFFKKLARIDWIHHILMMGIAIRSYYCPNSVIVTTNALLFFLNGLPGGIDYFLLTLVKYEIIRPIKEKELNSYLNIWIRSPGVIVGTYCMYLTTIYANYSPDRLTRDLILIILLWNAQYFTYRVIGNYYTKLSIKSEQFEKRMGRSLSSNDLKSCLNDGSVITEKDVIEELEGQKAELSRLMGDVFPTDDEGGD